MAWVAARAEGVAAPLVVFPLAAGLVLAGLLAAAAWTCRAAHVRSVVAMALCASLVAAAAQHVWSYRAAVARARRMQMAAEAEAARRVGKARGAVAGLGALIVEPPGSVLAYLQDEARRGRPLWQWRMRGTWAWLWWGLDGLLLAGAACWGTARIVRWPYCDGCGSWYRTIRAGQLTAEAVAEVAPVAGVHAAEFSGCVRARVMACAGGCGPALLIITRRGAGLMWRVWVSHDVAERVTTLLRRRC
jgi:hypothetical protein